MALRVWLPLNGNLENQGLSDIQIVNNGATINNSGKIGSCYSFDGTDDYISLSNLNFMPDMLPKEWTICFWVYNNDSGDRSIYFSNYQIGGVGDASFGFEKTTGELLRIVFNSGKFDNTISACSIDVGKWTHLTISKNINHLVSVYKNGNLVASYTNSNCASNGTLYYLGRDNRTGATTLNGKLNDFRIYDECLSQRQIKEISKGLVAHYKLEASNINTNLAVFNPLINSGSSSISFDRTTNTYTMVAPVGDSTWGYGAAIGATNKCIVPYNSYYRFSFEVYVPTEHVLVVDYNNYSNDSSVASWSGNDNDLGSARLTNTKTIPANTWTKCVFGSQNAHASNTSHVDIYENSKIGLRTASDTEPVTWYLRNFKFELDNKATDYVPYGYDPMEFLTTDVSGNGYNGIINGTLSYNADSPRYASSTTFNGSSHITSAPGSMAWCNFDNLTISTWLNPTTSPSGWSGSVGIQQDSGYTAGKIFSISNYAGKFSVQTDSSANWVTTQSETLLLNTWSHCVAVLENGTNLKMYLNGNLIKTTTLDWGTLTATAADTRLAIGVDLPGGDEYYTGSISDVRIYATALTADDILTLYKTSGIIDNEGNVYAYEFKEE